MKMIGFHTPKLPTPLGLDLPKLQGGGSCPSQFYGETHDGLDVYVRYRGGTLRVYVGNEVGDDALRDGNCILEADIGPPFDGSMSLTQFCTNFGVTINGTIPDEADPEAHHYANLTGQTTFWKANLSQITIETARKIVAKAWSAFPNALLVKPITNDKFKLERLELTTPERIDTLHVWLIDGASLLTEILRTAFCLSQISFRSQLAYQAGNIRPLKTHANYAKRKKSWAKHSLCPANAACQMRLRLPQMA